MCDHAAMPLAWVSGAAECDKAKKSRRHPQSCLLASQSFHHFEMRGVVLFLRSLFQKRERGPDLSPKPPSPEVGAISIVKRGNLVGIAAAPIAIVLDCCACDTQRGRVVWA